MGFGFNLILVFVLVPLTGLLLMTWAISQSRILGYVLGLMWGGVILLVILSMTLQSIFAKKVLTHEDYRGSYVIDRDMFPGTNADWQYDHFRFEITDDDSIHFHATNGARIVETWTGHISTVVPYSSARLIIHMQPPVPHVLECLPTTYRDTWNFKLVFHSKHYHNMYFKQGRWKPIRR